ncbi:MAG: extracellular solute-binding protein [Devosia sp.]|uniref:extracellular solute-binding protein n=1 Tax=Devosia sp. TaxID=1871048 RepID=UPI001A58E81A|nr:extracellular solute-binding protein [Devosia sp.]MBL8599189.1 extracellular solute-binding protein [Devosia sp.]
MTWSHPRGYDPMVATALEWERRGGMAIHWDKRSLQDFESFPVEELARQYDLIVIDHPHVGQVTAENCLAPLDPIVDGFVGASYPSYTYDGSQWAYPIDAAAQVMAYRADLLPQPPASWDEVVQLAYAGQVVLPMLAPHSLMTFYTLCANRGAPCSAETGDLIDSTVGAEVVEQIRRVTSLIDPSNFAMDPIAATEAMARPDALVSIMPLGYGYVSYAREGFRPGRLTFADIPLPGHWGSALGGTGIAVSGFSAHLDAAKAYAAFVASADVQRGLYAESGGQPGHAAGWEDEAVNAASGNFYRNTRQTLQLSYVRPRHRGYMAFQQEASVRLNAGLLGGDPARAIVADLNVMFRESF